MKAIDDITRTAEDALYEGFDFGYDERPLVAGELGAGVLAPIDGEREPFDDTELVNAVDKPDWLVAAGF
jgi:hypothetical protein